MYIAKLNAQTEHFASIKNNSDKNHIFKLAKKLKHNNNADIVGDKCVCNDEDLLTLTVEDKLKAWHSHYNKQLNEEFAWDASSLSNDSPCRNQLSTYPQIYSVKQFQR